MARTLAFKGRYGTARKVARWAWKNRRVAWREGRRGIRKFRAYRNRRRSRRGYASRAAPSSWSTGCVDTVNYPDDQTTLVSLAKRTLSVQWMHNLPKSGGMRDRIGNSIYLKGFKLCFYIHNNQNIGPIIFHWAILQRKNKCISTLDEWKESFFRNHSSETEKASDFVDDVTASGWNMEYICFPINPDRYNVITHRKVFLYNENTYNFGANAKNIKLLDKYIPIKRRMNFEQVSGAYPEKAFSLAYWWMPLKSTEWVGANTINIRHSVTTHFRNLV